MRRASRDWDCSLRQSGKRTTAIGRGQVAQWEGVTLREKISPPTGSTVEAAAGETEQLGERRAEESQAAAGIWKAGVGRDGRWTADAGDGRRSFLFYFIIFFWDFALGIFAIFWLRFFWYSLNHVSCWPSQSQHRHR
ncbi:hypothetical protein BDW71DRAFT_90658 [Aspergillus fruticulosus]